MYSLWPYRDICHFIFILIIPYIFFLCFVGNSLEIPSWYISYIIQDFSFWEHSRTFPIFICNILGLCSALTTYMQAYILSCHIHTCCGTGLRFLAVSTEFNSTPFHFLLRQAVPPVVALYLDQMNGIPIALSHNSSDIFNDCCTRLLETKRMY